MSRSRPLIAHRFKEDNAGFHQVDDCDFYTVIKLLPFKRKLKRLEHSLSSDYRHIIYRAIISDLADEITVFETCKVDALELPGLMESWQIFDHYNHKTFINNKKYGLQFSQEFRSILLNFEYTVKTRPNFCDSACCGSRKPMVSSLCSGILNRIINGFFKVELQIDLTQRREIETAMKTVRKTI